MLVAFDMVMVYVVVTSGVTAMLPVRGTAPMSGEMITRVASKEFHFRTGV
jgi:hypothetical protein